MMVPLVDVILIIFLFGFIFYGFFFGLIRSFGNLFGVFLGAILASRLYLPVTEYLDWAFLGYENLSKVVIFIFLFTLINRLTEFVFFLLDKTFGLLTIIPFLKTINRLAGAALGFVTGSLIIGLILYVISKYAILDNWIGRWLVDSTTASAFLKFSEILLPLLPEVLKKIKGLM